MQGEAAAVHATAAAGGGFSELRLQLYVAIVSFVLGAAGALHCMIIEALCNDPAWFDNFVAPSSSITPLILHTSGTGQISRECGSDASTANLKRLTPREPDTLVGIFVGRCFSNCIARKQTNSCDNCKSCEMLDAETSSCNGGDRTNPFIIS